MTEIDFDVLGIVPERYAAAPTLNVRLRLTERTGARIWALALRCQVRIEPQRRPYGAEEANGLIDLFGDSSRWGQTVKPFLWAHAATMVRGFTSDIELDLPLPCTYDFEVAAAKYLHALRDGDVPLVLLFNGTVFSRKAADEPVAAEGISVEQIPWHKEASYRLPVKVWRDLMDAYFPNSGWIRLDRDTLDALQRFKSSHALPSWEEALTSLLEQAPEPTGQVAP